MALFTKDTIDRVRDAVDMVHLVSEKTDLRRVGLALDRAVPVPRRAHAVVLRERRGEALLLLRLRRGRRRLQVRPADRGRSTSRRPWSCWRSAPACAWSARRTIRRRSSAAGAGERLHALLERAARLLRELPPRRPARPRPRGNISPRADSRTRSLTRIPRRLLAERLGPDAARSAAERFHRGGARGRRPGAARARWRSLRPLPGPDHVPARRRARTRARLRGAADGGGARAEVPEHLRERPLPQGSPAVRDRRRP